jgi:hypothetical protein
LSPQKGGSRATPKIRAVSEPVVEEKQIPVQPLDHRPHDAEHRFRLIAQPASRV